MTHHELPAVAEEGDERKVALRPARGGVDDHDEVLHDDAAVSVVACAPQ